MSLAHIYNKDCGYGGNLDACLHYIHLLKLTTSLDQLSLKIIRKGKIKLNKK